MNADDRAAEILAECLEHPTAEWSAAVDRACAEHPDLAATIRELFNALPTDEQSPAPARIGEFRVLGRLGAGAMGSVHLAEFVGEPAGRRVALKMIRAHLIDQPEARTRFRREAAVLQRLDHPSIVRVLAHGEHDHQPFLAMEFIPGVTLAAALRELSGRPARSLAGSDLARALGVPASGLPQSFVQAVVALIERVALAVAHAHDLGVLHRDLKPGNLMVTDDGRPVIVDFGLAAFVDAPPLTRTGGRVGSLPYMAPELLRKDARAANERTDVYALGVTLYELLTLTVPFADSDDFVVQRKIRRGEVTPLRRVNPDIPRDVVTVCMAAMDVDPRHRIPTARAFADELGRVLRLQPIATQGPGPVRRLQHWARRHPVSAAMATGAAVLVALLIGMGLLQQRAEAQTRIAAWEVAWRRAATDLARGQALADLARRIPALDERQLPRFDAWLVSSNHLEATHARERPRAAELLAAYAMPTRPLPEALWQLPPEDERALATALLRIGCADSMPGHLQRRDLIARERAIARALAERSVTGATARSAWQRVQAELAALPEHSDPLLPPQIGLLPLPRTPDAHRPRFVHVATVPEPGTDDPRPGVTFELIPAAGSAPAFFLASSPLTQRQWAHIAGEVNPGYPLDETAILLPHDRVGPGLARYGMELPTSAQWQRAGMTTPDGRAAWTAEAAPHDADPALVYPALAVKPAYRPWQQLEFAASEFRDWRSGVFGRQLSGAMWRTRQAPEPRGEHLEVLTLSGLTFCVLIAPHARWDPTTQGRWDSIVMTLQARNDAGWGIGSMLVPAIEQGGKWFLANDWDGSGGEDEWHPFATAPLVPEQFFHVHPRDWTAGVASPIGRGDAPDFTPGAAPMHFGFGLFAISNGLYRESFDDWRIVIRW